MSIRTRALGLATVALLAGPAVGNGHGSFHDRIEQADARVAERPKQAEPYLIRADVYRRHGDLESAFADLHRAARLEPGRSDLAFHRGRLLVDAARAEEARVELSEFLAREPEHAAAYALRADAWLQLGRPLEAARDLDRTIRFAEVALPEQYLARARALTSAGEAHLSEAIRGLDAGIDRLGLVPSLTRAAIDLELRLGDVDAALARVDIASTAAARKDAWLLRRAEILAGAGRFAEARSDYQRALAAVERLPASRRAAPATLRVTESARAGLEALDAPVR